MSSLGESSVSITDHYTKWNIRRIPLSQHIKEQRANWGRNDFGRAESLTSTMQVIPFFDYDEEFATKPRDFDIDESNCASAISMMFGDDPNFSYERQVFKGWRHGLKPPNKDGIRKFKVSFRFFVRGYAIAMGDIPKLIHQYLGKDSPFDGSVYSKKKNMSVPGTCKSTEDPRVLEVEHPDRLEMYCIQHLVGDEQPLTGFPDDVSRRSSVGTLGSGGPPEWEDVEGLLVDFGFNSPRHMATYGDNVCFTSDDKGLQCPCCKGVHDNQHWKVMVYPNGSIWVKSYSTSCTRRLLMEVPEIIPSSMSPSEVPAIQQALAQVFEQIPLLTAGYDRDMRECQHVKQHLETCPACSKHHHEDLWYIYEPLSSIFTMRNSAFSCRERLLPFFGNPHLLNISTNWGSDRDYANLFISEHENMYTSDSITILRFDKRWMVVKDPDMQNIVQDWLSDVMKQLFLLLGYEKTMRRGDKQKMPDDLKPYAEMYASTEKYLGKEGNMRNLLTCLKRKLRKNMLWQKMDLDPHVLGVGNGVILLEEGTFRPATQQDLVSKTVGYDWEEGVDPVIEAEVEDFFAQLYPVEEERRMAQLWGGYCCIGKPSVICSC